MKEVFKFYGIALGALMVVVLIITFSIGSWYVGRRINYKFSYRSLVQETVRDMVKAEALKP